MADVALIWNADTLVTDLALLNGDLQDGNDLASSAIMSLFTERRANAEDEIPDGTDDRRGWWGDNVADVEGDKIGSRLWLLARAKITSATVSRVEEYAAEALQWMIDDKVASRIDVSAARNGLDRIDLVVTIYRFDGTAQNLRFDDLWGALNG